MVLPCFIIVRLTAIYLAVGGMITLSCFEPLAMFRGVDQSTGEIIWKFLGPYNPETTKINNDLAYSEGDVVPRIYKIPCGKCLGCKLDYSRSWADRMMMELSSYEGKAIFLTLTYAEPPIVEYEDKFFYTLKKKDFQDFMKRLRSYYSDRTLRFFMCGEYGSPLKTFRPHYHAIIYGLSLDDFPKRRIVDQNELNQISYSDKIIEKRWLHGLISFSEVSYSTMSYVSRYSAKKVFGDNQKPCPLSQDSYVLMSRNPGIGHDFLLEHDFHDGKKYFMSDGIKVRKIYWPRYGNKILELKDTPEYNEKLKMTVDADVSRDLRKLEKTDLSYKELMTVEQAKKFDKVKKIFITRKEL